jgi:hypothetical protein
MATYTHLRLVTILFLLLGCGRKTNTQLEYKTRVDIQRDTVQMPVLVETFIPSPCDTNGILKNFKFETQAGPTKVKLETDGTRIIVKVKTDTIVKGYRVVSDTVRITSHSVTTKEVTPRWAWQLLVANIIVAASLIIYLYLRK